MIGAQKFEGIKAPFNGTVQYSKKWLHFEFVLKISEIQKRIFEDKFEMIMLDLSTMIT